MGVPVWKQYLKVLEEDGPWDNTGQKANLQGLKVNSGWIKDLTENPTLKEAQENTWELTGKPVRTTQHEARKERTNAFDYNKMKSHLQITRIKSKTKMICPALRSGSSWEGAAGRRDGLETLSSPSDRIQHTSGRVCFWASTNPSVLPLRANSS